MQVISKKHTGPVDKTANMKYLQTFRELVNVHTMVPARGTMNICKCIANIRPSKYSMYQLDELQYLHSWYCIANIYIAGVVLQIFT